MKRLILYAFLISLTVMACTPQQEDIIEIAPTATLLPIVSHTPRFTATPVATRTPLPTFTFTPTETPIPPTPTLSPTPTATPTITGIIQSMQRVNVRESPSVESNTFTSLAPGTGVQVLGQNNEGTWYNIRMNDGREGWVSSRLLFVEEPPTPLPTATPSPDLTALFLGTPLPTAVLGGGTVTPTPPSVVTTATPVGVAIQATETLPPTQPRVPVIDLDTINRTATALAGGVPTETATWTPTPDREVTLPPTPTEDPQSTAVADSPGLPLAQADALERVNVFAFCDNRSYGVRRPDVLPAGSTIDIFWAWFAMTEQQVRDHVNSASHELRINGELIPDVNQFRTNIFREGGDYVTYWYVPYGPLPAGDYEITYAVSWSRQIFDGYGYFGPGTSTPFEQETCNFSVR